MLNCIILYIDTRTMIILRLYKKKKKMNIKRGCIKKDERIWSILSASYVLCFVVVGLHMNTETYCTYIHKTRCVTTQKV
jgi:hypothetical protein